MKILVLISIVFLAVPLAAQIPPGKYQARGNITVAKDSGTLRGYGMSIVSGLRKSFAIEMEIDSNGKMSVIQKISLGGYDWENRFDILWIFEAPIPGESRFKLVNTSDGSTVGKAFCNSSRCEYELDLSEHNLKIWERLEKMPDNHSYDLMGTATDSNSWFGQLQVYYRAKLTPVSKPVD